MEQVLDLLRAGKTNVDIASQLGCSREYIRQCRNKFENRGLFSSEVIHRHPSRAKAAMITKQGNRSKLKVSKT